MMPNEIKGEYEWHVVCEEGNPLFPGTYFVLLMDVVGGKHVFLEKRQFCDMADIRYRPFLMSGEDPDRDMCWCENPSEDKKLVMAWMSPSLDEMGADIEDLIDMAVIF